MIPATEINYFKLKNYVVLLNNSGVLDANIDARMKKEELYMKFLEAVDDISEDNPKYELLPKVVVQFFNICVTNDTMPEEPETPEELTEGEDITAHPEEDAVTETTAGKTVPTEAPSKPPEEERTSEPPESDDQSSDKDDVSEHPKDRLPEKENKPKKEGASPPFKKDGKSFEEIAADLWNEGKTSDDDFFEVFKELYQGRGKQASDEWFMKRAKIYKGIAKRKADKPE